MARGDKKKIFKGNALREPNLTRFSRRTFANRLARPKCFAAKLWIRTIETYSTRLVFDRRNTRNLVNRGTDSLRSSIIRKTFRFHLYKRLEKFTPTHRRDTCTVLGNLSNIALCIES